MTIKLNWKAFGKLLQEIRNEARLNKKRLTQPKLLEEIERIIFDEEEALKKVGAEIVLIDDKEEKLAIETPAKQTFKRLPYQVPDISKYETGKSEMPRSRVLTFIFVLSRQKNKFGYPVMTLGKANELVSHLGWDLHAEIEAIFDVAPSTAPIVAPIEISLKMREVESDYGQQNAEPFLRFYEKLIDRLYHELAEGNNGKRFFVLHGISGMGKSKIASAVFNRLQQAHIPAIFHSIDHIVDSDDVLEAIDALIEQISSELGISNTLSIDEQKKLIKEQTDSTKSGQILILTGLRGEIEDKFIQFLEQELPQSVKILLTDDAELSHRRTNTEYEFFSIELEKKDIRNFLSICGLKRKLNDDDVKKIFEKTGGSSFALRQIVRLFQEEPERELDEVLEDQTINFDGWFNSLAPQIRQLLKAHSLFRANVDWRILAYICGVTDAYVSNEQLDFKENLKHLCELGVILPDNDFLRFEMKEPYRPFIWRKSVHGSEEGKELKRRWVEAYLKLRPDKPHVGWAVLADYSPDKLDWVNFAEEIDTIIDVVKYCIARRRPSEYQLVAAQIVNNFRSTLYATGKWDERVKLCNKVLEQQNKQSPIYAELLRLIAWIDCFRDNYDDAEKNSNAASKYALVGIQRDFGSISEIERNVFRQVYYKTEVNLGRIALRKAQNAAVWGQLFEKVNKRELGLEKSDMERFYNIAHEWFEDAKSSFKQARSHFVKAKMYAHVEFPGEVNSTDFLLAEVLYYDRHFLGEENRDELLQSVLQDAMSYFERILSDAEKNAHNRLIAHVHYYLGKVCRRLSRNKTRSGENLFGKAWDHLEKALQIAEKFHDNLLEARIQFALGQWYIERARLSQGADDTNKDEYVKTSEKLVVQSSRRLWQLGMKIECLDAVTFLLLGYRGVSEPKIDLLPDELISLFRTRCEGAIFHFNGQYDSEELSKRLIDRLFVLSASKK